MKRHTSLAPLSRQHHGALILAQLLKKGAPAYKGLPTDIDGKAAYAVQFYNNELLPHFETEEQVIIQKIKGIHTGLDLLSNEILEDHKALRILFNSISNHPDLATHLDYIGCTLEMHIRKEERAFFPLIQTRCSEGLLKEIAQALTA